MCRPRVLSIHMETCTFLNLPVSIFTCMSIEEMSLRLETHDVNRWYNFLQMRSINLPFLKNLELGEINLDDDIMRMIISGCPVLELVLVHCWMEVSMISSNVLKKLVLKEECLQCSTLEISCPGVLFLIITSMNMSGIILKNMASLVTADITFTEDNVSDLRILGGLSNVTSLYLMIYSNVMDLLLADIPNCPPLKNLKSLTIRELDFSYDWNIVACFLQHSTNLKDLTLHFFRPRENDTEEEFQDDISFRHMYLEAVKISCPGKTVKLAGEVVYNYARVETTANIIIL